MRAVNMFYILFIAPTGGQYRLSGDLGIGDLGCLMFDPINGLENGQ